MYLSRVQMGSHVIGSCSCVGMACLSKHAPITRAYSSHARGFSAHDPEHAWMHACMTHRHRQSHARTQHARLTVRIWMSSTQTDADLKSGESPPPPAQKETLKFLDPEIPNCVNLLRREHWAGACAHSRDNSRPRARVSGALLGADPHRAWRRLERGAIHRPPTPP